MSPEKQALKTIVITGGSSGIGLDAAKRMLDEGPEYRLVLIGKEAAKLEDCRRELDPSGDRVTCYPCDLREPAQIKRTAERISTTHKSIYGLVNNAGIYPFGGVENTTDETWEDAMRVNLKAPFLLIQGLLEAMRRGRVGGRIVNVSSTAGILPNHFALAYSVSKAALIQLTRTLAKELGKDGITVNCVCPGIVKSPLHESYHRSKNDLQDFYAKRGAAFPLGRVGEPEDVASVIRFFLSEEASWITGDVFIVDGGRLLL